MFFNEEDKNLETVDQDQTVEQAEEVKESAEAVVEETKEEVQESTEAVTEENSEAANEVVEQDSNEDVPASKPAKNKPQTAEPIADEFLPGNFDPFARPINPRFANRKESEFEERVLEIKRVIKVTKGGRRFKFSALVVVGDKKGRVGYAVGKHIEVPEAIKKAVRQARKNLVNIKVVGSQDTVPHEIIGQEGAARVMLKPAAEGKGVIASDVVRAVVELAGIRNIYSKNLGTNNPGNVVRATINGLLKMKTAQEFANLKAPFAQRAPRNEKPSPKKQEAKKEEAA